jgi:FeS assembly SUF system regulator
MLKLSKKADYGLIALRHLAQHYGDAGSQAFSAADIALTYRVSAPLMAKVLQRLARQGLVVARHGSNGGYALARHPSEITALEAISAIDGPLAITSCISSHGECDATSHCTVKEPLRRVNESILKVLSAVKLSEMTETTRAQIVELRV